jgi:2'-5' RNA ligase
MSTRRQLTLFVPRPAAAEFEATRCRLDPIQAELIRAHVTLCREDELADLTAERLWSRLAAAAPGPLLLGFGPAQRFHGHGILLPCVAGDAAFHALRLALLGPEPPRRLEPHITLAHPRNPRSTGNLDANLGLVSCGISLVFAGVSLIEQDGTAAWRVLEEAPFRSA